MIDQIETLLKDHYPKNKGFFVFGSSVYKTTSSQSDIDVVVIEDELHGQSKTHGKFDFQFVSLESFLKQVKKCDIKSLEGLFTDLKRFDFSVSKEDIDWAQLRSSISEKSSHSWVKAKKKLIDQEFYIGKKSLWHSLRIMLFGLQLSRHKAIVDFQEANPHYLPIITGSTNWEVLQGEYKSLYNQLHSDFKKIQPK